MDVSLSFDGIATHVLSTIFPHFLFFCNMPDFAKIDGVSNNIFVWLDYSGWQNNLLA
jgi:hypothetical protein